MDRIADLLDLFDLLGPHFFLLIHILYWSVDVGI